MNGIPRDAKVIEDCKKQRSQLVILTYEWLLLTSCTKDCFLIKSHPQNLLHSCYSGNWLTGRMKTKSACFPSENFLETTGPKKLSVQETVVQVAV